MNRHRSRLEMEELRDDFIRRCKEGDIDEATAQEIFKSVAGFAQFGFCKSHAAAFARTAYETAWLRLNHPAEYLCSLLNAQPMGFYHPSVLVEDGKRHGVKMLPVDVRFSRKRCTVESPDGNVVVRLGFNYVKELGPVGEAACEEASLAGAHSVRDLWRRTLLPRRAMEKLVLAGAFDGVEPGRSRRQLLWELKGIEEALPVRPVRRSSKQDRSGPGRTTASPARVDLLELPANAPPLPGMDARTRSEVEYAICEVSSGTHPIAFLRPRFDSLGCTPLAKVRHLPTRTHLRVAGLVIVRQAPMSASGFRFFTLADDQAHLDLVLRPAVAKRTRPVANFHPLLMVEGTLESENGRLNLIVDDVTALDRDGNPLEPNSARGGDNAAWTSKTSHDYR
jgi:error-prone DNA polymerase